MSGAMSDWAERVVDRIAFNTTVDRLLTILVTAQRWLWKTTVVLFIVAILVQSITGFLSWPEQANTTIAQEQHQ